VRVRQVLHGRVRAGPGRRRCPRVVSFILRIARRPSAAGPLARDTAWTDQVPIGCVRPVIRRCRRVRIPDRSAHTRAVLDPGQPGPHRPRGGRSTTALHGTRKRRRRYCLSAMQEWRGSRSRAAGRLVLVQSDSERRIDRAVAEYRFRGGAAVSTCASAARPPRECAAGQRRRLDFVERAASLARELLPGGCSSLSEADGALSELGWRGRAGRPVLGGP
jgi:hypothetical protein